MSSLTIWKNANIATMSADNDYGIINNAMLVVQDKKIIAIGHAQDIEKNYVDVGSIVDVKNKWITPGLIDCHTHLVYAGNRIQEFVQRLDGESYVDIAKSGGGIMATVEATRQASEENLYEQSVVRLEEMLAKGVTTLEIKSGYGLSLDAEAKMLRVARRLQQNYPVTIHNTFLGAHVCPPEFSDSDSYISHVCETMLPALNAEGLIDAVDGFCENIAFTYEQLSRVFDKANELDLPVKLHAEQLSVSGGAELAAKYHALSADHLEYVSEEQVQAMAEAGTVAVVLPGAYYFLQAECKPPINLFNQYNVPIAVATDCNPGSSPICSLPLVMNMACMLFNMNPLQVLQGVTSNAAKALGLENQLGILAVNKVADFVIWDIEHPQELAYQLGTNPCMSIIKQGQQV